MEKFTAAMVHDKDTITKLSVTQYNCFEFKSKLVRIVIAIALIVYGLYANQSMYTPRICLILGCILIANVNLRPRVRANKIIEQIGARAIPSRTPVFPTAARERRFLTRSS